MAQKWKAFIEDKDNLRILYVYHYQHPILTIILDAKQIVFAWYQTDADKRGLLACMEYLIEKGTISRNHFNEIIEKTK